MKLWKKFLTAGLAVVMAAGLTACGGNKEETIKVGTSPDFPPYEFLKDGEVVGVEIELIKALAEDMGKKVDVQAMDFDGVLAAVTTSKVQLGVSGLSITDERKQTMDFTDPIFENSVRIMFKKDKPYETPDALKGKKIGFQVGTTSGDYLKDELPDAEANGYKEYIQAITDLENGKIDAIVMDQIPAERMIADKADLQLSKEPLYVDTYAFATKKGENAELIKNINAGLKKLKENGKYDEIVNKYFK
ncbi:MAG: transporter substrate-binding domain-containing protein [Eubacteriales bacterium]|nr:transporter substrate-binding domain-containing protein [Eubacteriales bacterium]